LAAEEEAEEELLRIKATVVTGREEEYEKKKAQ
jgi:hypothetical protein